MGSKRIDKDLLRARVRQTLSAVNPAVLASWAEALQARLLLLPEIKLAKTVMLYSPVSRWHEVPVEPLARNLIAAGTRVALPQTGDRASAGLEPMASWIRDWDEDRIPKQRVAGDEYLKAPRAGLREAEPEMIDVVIVPGLAFDWRGNRLGRGGGFYDRFLARLRPDARRIGVAWDVQYVAEVPVEEHDQRMDVIVTDVRVHEVPRQSAKDQPFP